MFEKKMPRRIHMKPLNLVKMKSSGIEKWNLLGNFYFSRTYKIFIIGKVLLQQNYKCLQVMSYPTAHKWEKLCLLCPLKTSEPLYIKETRPYVYPLEVYSFVGKTKLENKSV